MFVCIQILVMVILFSLFGCEVFFFKQKTAYEMRISDWSSDVCSSDLEQIAIGLGGAAAIAAERDVEIVAQPTRQAHVPAPPELGDALADVRLVEVLDKAEAHHQDRKSTRLNSSH